MSRAAALTVALLATAIAAAEPGPPPPTGAGPALAVFDVRPVKGGPARATDLDLLAEAVALSQELRATFADPARRVLTRPELRELLGANARVLAFECRERVACLRPLLERLAAVRVPHAVVGTVTRPRGGRVLALQLVDTARGTVRRTVTLTLDAAGLTLAARGRAVELLDELPRGAPEPPPALSAAPAAPAAEVPADPARDSGGDVVETIGGDDLRSPLAPPAPEAADSFQLHGWARTLVATGLKMTGYFPAQPDNYDVPYDALTARTELLARARFRRGSWFELSLSGSLGYSVLEQNPTSPTATFTLVNGQSVRARWDTLLRELFVGFYGERYDLRVGQQRVAWGRADGHSPNDVVNAHDLTDPLLAEEETRHLPTLLVRADADLGFGTLQVIASPFFTANRYDIYGTNWATLQADGPMPLRGLFGVLTRGASPALQAAVTAALAESGLPRRTFRDPLAGVRFAGSRGGVDFAGCYHYGFDPNPRVRIDPAFAQQLATIAFNHPPADLLSAFATGPSPLTADYVRRHHVGGDAATTVGPLVLRLEAAWDSARVFNRRDLSGLALPVVDGVAAVEYQAGGMEKLLLVELTYSRLLTAPDAPLLFAARDNFGVALAARWLLAERWVAELHGVVGLRPVSYAVRPEAGLKHGALTVRLGALVLGGEEFSFGSWYRRNTCAYALARFAF